jgi:hypothetical protein
MNKQDKLLQSARAWLVTEIKAGRTDSGFAQRFSIWLRQQPNGATEPNETALFFLACCQAEHIHAGIVEDELVFGFYRDGVQPQPYCEDYEGMKI